MIIGITGYKQSGKDTVCNLLFDCFSMKIFKEIHRIGFFDSAKEEIARELSTSVEILNKAKVTHAPIRRLLQEWGDYKKALHGEDYFLIVLNGKIKLLTTTDNKLFIIPDVRFPKEAQYIISQGGCILKVDRKIENTDTHNSESSINKIQPHFTVFNHGTLGDLKREVGFVAQFIKEQWHLI